MSLLEISGLRASYGRVEVLHGVDLTVDEGQIIAILGANGAGKTSFLRAVTGGVSASGARRFNGEDLAGRTTAAIARLGIGHVPAGRGTFTDLTVEENLRLGALSRPRDRRSETAKDFGLVFATFPILKDFRRRPAGALSGGQAQMLAIARALLARPKLLLIDEPSLGLAPLTSRDLFERFEQVRHEWALTIVLAEQNARLSVKVADRAVIFARGLAVHEGSTSDPATVDAIQSIYFGGAADAVDAHPSGSRPPAPEATQTGEGRR
ncbi:MULTISPECIES: ABC transporter ATP-binding protein [unclassified Microbacterium]|uniref:ABC transporter ATP-binding protein n=1 Tax=unclassified Microbacterium TaxID=2609290 RepID=UPI00097EBFB0|nr:ABC transporter ATP-binding protein [Microbacterium sp. JB110]RCS57264.1 ABC transporter ATP-binding protein [Microbacterium sp. JB110]SJM58815.1 Branched-chain amino acid transport ATP-binding protein LivF (TC 3.A.1.4.1) [Frigoribacterium sp. JB110]